MSVQKRRELVQLKPPSGWRTLAGTSARWLGTCMLTTLGQMLAACDCPGKTVGSRCGAALPALTSEPWSPSLAQVAWTVGDVVQGPSWPPPGVTVPRSLSSGETLN